MELRQLKYFVRAAQTLNFSEAARSLYVTQSTLSQQIKALEQELGTMLFQRDSHSVVLTESGNTLLPLALRTIQDAEACREQITDLKQLLSGELNIGLTYSFSPILIETVKLFMKQYPGVRLTIRYKTMEELMDLMRKRQLDLVLAFKPSVSYEEIESHRLFVDHLSVILRNDHPLANRESISIDDLKPYRLAMPRKGLQARNAVDKYVNVDHSGLNVCLEINDANILLDIVQHNNLVSILSETTVRNRSQLKAIPLNLPENQMVGCVHILKKSYRKRSVDVFLKILYEIADINRI